MACRKRPAELKEEKSSLHSKPEKEHTLAKEKASHAVCRLYLSIHGNRIPRWELLPTLPAGFLRSFHMSSSLPPDQEGEASHVIHDLSSESLALNLAQKKGHFTGA